MSKLTVQRTQAIQYLLGTLTEEEKTRIEEALFADDATFEELEVAEGELIDAYVRRELSAEDRKRFETKLLRLPRVVERIHFAQALAERASNVPSIEHDILDLARQIPSPSSQPRTPWWHGFSLMAPSYRAAVTVYVLLLLVGGLTVLYGWIRLRSESERLASEKAGVLHQKEQLEKSLNEETARNEQLAADLRRAQDERIEHLKLIEDLKRRSTPGEDSASQSIATIFLRPGLLRGNTEGRDLAIRANTQTIRLTLLLEANDYQGYSATIKSAEGTAVYSRQGMKARTDRMGPRLNLDVPAKSLPINDYVIIVSGLSSTGKLEPVSEYAFRLTRLSHP